MRTNEMRIAWVDDHPDNFHANHYLKLLREELKDSGFRVSGCHALQQRAGKAWAARQGIPYFESPEALNLETDAFMVLAPSSAETHLELCRRILPFGKPTFVDKTFAPDLATAEAIFALAEKHGVPLQSASALRYTNIQREAKNLAPGEPRHLVAWGGGRWFREYAIHPVELAVSCLGPEAESLMRRGPEKQSQLLVNFSGERTAVINVYTGEAHTPFAASLTSDRETKILLVDNDFFLAFLEAQLEFFRTGRVSIPKEETLAIRRLLDAAESPGAHDGFVKI